VLTRVCMAVFTLILTKQSHQEQSQQEFIVIELNLPRVNTPLTCFDDDILEDLAACALR